MGSDLSRSLGLAGFARKHPNLLVGGAAALGVVLGPALARTFRSPSRTLRGVGRALTPFGHSVRATAVGALAAMLRAPHRPG